MFILEDTINIDIDGRIARAREGPIESYSISAYSRAVRIRRARYAVTIDGVPVDRDELFTVWAAGLVRIRTIDLGRAGFALCELVLADEGVSWCRGWEEEAVTALAVVAALR